MLILAWILFGIGSLLSILNFYLSFLRYPILRLRGVKKTDCQHVSGFPLFGSLFLVVAGVIFAFYARTATMWLAVGIAAIDTGGLHWLGLSMIYLWFHDRGNRDNPNPTR